MTQDPITGVTDEELLTDDKMPPGYMENLHSRLCGEHGDLVDALESALAGESAALERVADLGGAVRKLREAARDVWGDYSYDEVQKEPPSVQRVWSLGLMDPSVEEES